MSTILEAIQTTEQALLDADAYFGHGTNEPWDEAVFLVLGACGMPLDSDVSVLSQPLSAIQLQQWQEWCKRRIDAREPLAYLLGYTWFAGVQFAVAKGVIVPRSPIAELIENGFVPFLKQPPTHCLDLCAGSGCIGIAAALQMDIPDVDLVEIDAQAQALAQTNIENYNLEGRVRVIGSDLFAQLDTGRRYDLIVSNPPYVDANDYAQMPAEYFHEPKLALVSGADGLEITARILVECVDWLTPDGLLIVEVGNSEVALQQQLPQVPFTWIEFANGGNGVFALTAQQCHDYHGDFVTWQQMRKP